MERVEARATVNLAGFSIGETKRVDPSDPFIDQCIQKGILVVEGREPAVKGADESVDNGERLGTSE